MNSLFRLIGSLVLLIGANQVLAAGDSEAGKAKAAVCAACHGVEGISASPDFPHLAAQVPGYIARQLKAFKTGSRINALMTGQVAALSDQDMADLDAYFSSKPAVESVVKTADVQALVGDIDPVELFAKGEKLYRGGDAKRSIAACMGCHGPAGTGIPSQYPRISGQSAKYLHSQLLAFKAGERTDDRDIMNSIAFRLSTEEIGALSLFLQGLH